MLRPPVLSRMLPRWIGSSAAMPARFSTASVLLNTRAPVADLTNCLRLNLMMTPPWLILPAARSVAAPGRSLSSVRTRRFGCASPAGRDHFRPGAEASRSPGPTKLAFKSTTLPHFFFEETTATPYSNIVHTVVKTPPTLPPHEKTERKDDGKASVQQ